MLPILVVVVLMAACSGGGSSKLTVSGTVTIITGPERADTSPCGDPGRVIQSLKDITTGATVKVTDQSGTLLGTAQLSAPTPTTDPGGYANCAWPFTVSVPAGKTFYQFSVADRPATAISESDLRAKQLHVDLTVS